LAILRWKRGGHDAQELVTAVVPEGVVDLLEAVEVDQEKHRRDRGHGRLQFHLGVLEEGATVLKRGELVGAGVAEVVGPRRSSRQRQSHADDDDAKGPERHVGCRPVVVASQGHRQEGQGQETEHDRHQAIRPAPRFE